MTYNIRYKLFTETIHVLTHTTCKTHNYFYKLANDMILKHNYSEYMGLRENNAVKIQAHKHKHKTSITIDSKGKKVRPLP